MKFDRMIDIAALNALAERLAEWLEDMEDAKSYARKTMSAGGSESDRQTRVLAGLSNELRQGHVELDALHAAIRASREANAAEETEETAEREDFNADNRPELER